MDELLKEYPAVLSISDVAEILNITPATDYSARSAHAPKRVRRMVISV